jgi:UDP-glucose 4-epimerase
MSEPIINKTILIFGGTGSLGYELNKRYSADNIIYNFSRDENKHWQMRIFFQNNPNINFIIGNVSDFMIVQQTILRIKPNIIIIASAMKHIDQCENNTGECIKTNLLGTQNILNSIETNLSILDALKTVVFISSDKACSPINTYGLCKAMSENIVVEKSFYINSIKFINVRYGNVLNSNGSIIPLLHKIGQNPDYKHFSLTDPKMTRFVMSLEQSVDLIHYSIINGDTGDTIIPKLISMNLIDLFDIFSKKYNKPVVITNLRPGEKLLESLINESQSYRIVKNDNYIHIKSVFNKITIFNNELQDYNSKINPLTKDELEKYLIQLQLI